MIGITFQPMTSGRRHTHVSGSQNSPIKRRVEMRFQTIRRVSVVAIALVVLGCGSAGQATSGPSVSPTGLAMASATPSPEPSKAVATASAALSSPTPIRVASIPVEPALELVWDAKGPSPTVLGDAVKPVQDPSGRIWAAASSADLFWVIGVDGKSVDTWGTPGRAPGQLNLHRGDGGWGAAAFRSDGGYYVADSGNDRVQQFDQGGTFIRTWGSFGTSDGQFTLPIDIATDGADNVYVLSDTRRDIQRFSPTGNFERLVTGDVGPYFAVAKDGTVYAAHNGAAPQIWIFAPDGSWRSILDLQDLVHFVTGIALTPAGKILVASSSNGGSSFVYEDLIEIDTGGHALHRWPTGGEGIDVSGDGTMLYVTNLKVGPGVRAYALPSD